MVILRPGFSFAVSHLDQLEQLTMLESSGLADNRNAAHPHGSFSASPPPRFSAFQLDTLNQPPPLAALPPPCLCRLNTLYREC